MNKDELINYIKENDPFYRFTIMKGYSLEQLLVVKERIDAAKKTAESPDSSEESRPSNPK
jgi:hypothetical protein